MGIVLLCGVGVGLATVIGSLISFFVKRELPHRLSDALFSFAAGVMLGATFFSLLLPAFYHSESSVWLCIAGVAVGALLIRLMDKCVPHLHKLLRVETTQDTKFDRVFLFLIAIAIHNFPEGMAVGVSFGSGDTGNALSIAIGIALQNIPEGMITILPLLLAGVSRKRALAAALVTGLTEVAGTLFGYVAVSLAAAILPFVLALAAGTMLYVISHEMIPETHSHGYEDTATFSLIGGLIVMMLIQYFA